ncbi:FHA domain protein [uncultured Eubacteriales bacterium]|uniref:FHA domain protein n=1 Tax=uncultured Eubacteriales bacterium TaxID=172733 RepID=A0A212JJR4_9FIRM|nr:FHA domain protein [uncultured Eubacteriales bacterium]
MDAILSAPQAIMDQLTAFLSTYPVVAAWYTTIARFVFPVLALLILVRSIRSLLTVPHLPEVWGYLSLPNGAEEPLTHWENTVGRAGACDVTLNYPTVSRQHAALMRGEDDTWTVYDLESKGGVTVNGDEVEGSASIDYGDVLGLGGVETVLLSVSAEEKEDRRKRRRASRPVSPWLGLIFLTIFQLATAVQLVIAAGEGATAAIPTTFLCLIAVMWAYFLFMRSIRRVGFEMETIAFFLSTLSLAVTASSAPKSLFKQFATVLLGLVLFVVLCVILRDLDRVKKLRWLAAAGAIGLLLITVLLGRSLSGARNWIIIGSLSFQPSELAKVCYIFAGAATLERLFRKRNIWLFIALTGACMGTLALMSDFGTAAIFFITFLVIAYLRSGDWATLAGITAAGVAAAAVIALSKPYILRRFSAWGHVWSDPSNLGFQQVRAMSAAASGGLIGVGAGEGWLHRIGAADTDLVFGMLCEEWGLIIGVLAVICIVTLAVFAVRSGKAGRSSYYLIAACGAGALLVFQTCLNVFGAVDILPLTGVTFPFVSNGGSAMLGSWGLLAFLKATDTRQNASFAIRLPSKRRERAEELARRTEMESAEEEASDEED